MIPLRIDNMGSGLHSSWKASQKFQYASLFILFAMVSIANAQETISDIETKWEHYKTQISSAEIEYEQTLIAHLAPMNLDEVQVKVKALQSVNPDQLMREFVSQFSPIMPPLEEGQSPRENVRYWQQKKLTVRGDNFVSASETHDHLVFEDLHVVIDKTNKASRAFTKGECKLFTENLDWFRPFLELDDPETITIEKEADTLLLKLKANSSVVLDRASQIPVMTSIYYPNGKEPFRLEYNLHLTEFPGGITMPLARMEFVFQQNQLKSATLSVIQSADFNSPVSDATFTIEMKKKSKWFDFRFPDTVGGVFDSDVKNIYLFYTRMAATPLAENPDQSPASPFSWTTVFLIINGTVFVGLGMMFWKRSS